MRQVADETLKSYSSRFTIEMTHCEKITDAEALCTPKGGLNHEHTILKGCLQQKNFQL
jgi:hypothetical protein